MEFFLSKSICQMIFDGSMDIFISLLDLKISGFDHFDESLFKLFPLLNVQHPEMAKEESSPPKKAKAALLKCSTSFSTTEDISHPCSIV